jgi:hypothetical protein
MIPAVFEIKEKMKSNNMKVASLLPKCRLHVSHSPL